MTKEEILGTIPKIRRNKLDAEITQLVEVIGPIFEQLIPSIKEWESIRERYARLKVTEQSIDDLMHKVMEEKYPETYQWLTANDIEIK